MAIFLIRDHVILAKTTCYGLKDVNMSEHCAFREISVLTRKMTNFLCASEHFSTIYQVHSALSLDFDCFTVVAKHANLCTIHNCYT